MSKKKYVIETAFENMGIQKIMQLGLDDNGRIINWTDSIEDVEELNSDYINEHFGELQDEAYQKGINDGSLDVKQRVEGAYQRGLEDAWEAAQKVVCKTTEGGMSLDTLKEIFGVQSPVAIMQSNTAQQAIDKIKAYEDKQKDRIEVGDEVKAPRGKAVVTAVKDDLVHYFYSGGDYGCIELYHVTKTGKHYDIQSILEAMRT